jgi:class 3 adenylate cyclase
MDWNPKGSDSVLPTLGTVSANPTVSELVKEGVTRDASNPSTAELSQQRGLSPLSTLRSMGYAVLWTAGANKKISSMRQDKKMDLLVLAKDGEQDAKPWYSSWSLRFSSADESQYRLEHPPSSIVWITAPAIGWSCICIMGGWDGPPVYFALLLGLGLVVLEPVGAIKGRMQEMWMILFMAFSAILLTNWMPGIISRPLNTTALLIWILYFCVVSNELFTYTLTGVLAVCLGFISLGTYKHHDSAVFFAVFTLVFSGVAGVLVNRQRELCLRKGYQKARQLAVMEHKHYLLLVNCLHPSIAKLVRKGEMVNKEFPHAAILFIALHDFDYLVYQTSKPVQLFEIIAAITTKLDEIVVMYRKAAAKLEHVQGDYIVTSNAVLEVDNKVASKLGSNESQQLAITTLIYLVKHIFRYFQDEKNKMKMAFRVGLTVGKCSGAVVGKSRAYYRLFGDTINLASRLQQHGVPNTLHLSESAFELATGSTGMFKKSDFNAHVTDIKSKGQMATFSYPKSGNKVSEKAEERDIMGFLEYLNVEGHPHRSRAYKAGLWRQDRTQSAPIADFAGNSPGNSPGSASPRSHRNNSIGDTSTMLQVNPQDEEHCPAVSPGVLIRKIEKLQRETKGQGKPTQAGDNQSERYYKRNTNPSDDYGGSYGGRKFSGQLNLGVQSLNGPSVTSARQSKRANNSTIAPGRDHRSPSLSIQPVR